MKTNRTLAACTALLAAAALSGCVYDPTATSGVVTSGTVYSPGYAVSSLPSGYRTEVISNRRYYYHNGTYYRPRGNSYVVVDRPSHSRWASRDYDRDGIPNSVDRHNRYRGDRHYIPRLPSGYRTVYRDGRRYYRHGNTYYSRSGSGYIVVEF